MFAPCSVFLNVKKIGKMKKLTNDAEMKTAAFQAAAAAEARSARRPWHDSSQRDFGDPGSKTPEEVQANVHRLVYRRTRTRPPPIMTGPGINEGQGTFL